MEQLFFSIVSVLKIGAISKFNIRLPKAGTADGPLLVIANGPSLKVELENHLDIFKNADCIVSNNFAVSEYFLQIKPAYYVWLDAYMWTSGNEVAKQTIALLNHQVDWPLQLMVPAKALKKVEALFAERTSQVQLVAYNYTFFRGFDGLGYWLYGKNLCNPQALTVTVMSLFVGINMGFRKLILVGADQRWHENVVMTEQNILQTRVEHFYEDGTKVEYVPFYKGSIKEAGTNTAVDFFRIQLKTFEGYERLAGYAAYKGVKVVNASAHSFVDAFEKKPLTHAI